MRRRQYHYHEMDSRGGAYQPLLFRFERYIRTHSRMNFRELLENAGSRMDVIVTFLVVLELMKTGTVSVEQEGIEADIIITARQTSGEEMNGLELTSLG